MPTLTINGQSVQVGDDFLKLSPDQQNTTVEEIAKGLGPAAAPEPAPRSAAPSDWRAALAQALIPRGTPPTSLAEILNSPAGGIVRGLRDPIDQGAALAARGFQAVAPESLQPFAQQQVADVAAANRAAEQDYTQNWRQGSPPSFDVGRIAGNIAAVAPVSSAMPGAAASALLPRMVAGLGAGAISGAMQPVAPDNPDFWRQVGANAAIGGATGAVVPALTGGLARIIQPNTSPDVQMMMEAGVRPTPGQTLGGTVNRIEQGLTSIPGPGDVIKNARRNTITEFDRAAINKALNPIGETLETPGMGRAAIDEMQTKIGDAYDKIVPQLGIQASSPAAAQLQQDIGGILQMSRNMPDATRSQLQNILKDEILDKISPGGGMTGESFKEAESAIGRLASDYRNSAIASERQLGGALLQAQASMRNALQSANPDKAAELSAINNAFAHALRVNKAATALGGEPGIFTPAQLQAATKALDPTLRKRAFAAGDALMQDYAEAGKSVLGNTVPDSGTPYRALLAMLGIGGTGFGAGVPGALTSAAAALGLTGLTGVAYSPAGRWLLSQAFASRPAAAPGIANVVRDLSPGAAAVPAPVFGALGF